MTTLEKILHEIEETVERYKNNANFETVDICYGMNIAKKIIKKHLSCESKTETTIQTQDSNNLKEAVEKISDGAGIKTEDYPDHDTKCQIKLEPCPFCGGKASVIQTYCKETDFIGYKIHHRCRFFLNALETSSYDKENDAIKAWNERCEDGEL